MKAVFRVFFAVFTTTSASTHKKSESSYIQKIKSSLAWREGAGGFQFTALASALASALCARSHVFLCPDFQCSVWHFAEQ